MAFSIFFTTVSYPQDVENGNLIVHQSPSPKFHNISLQSYKGLPRFGTLNSYIKKNNLGVYPRRQDPATLEKYRKVSLSYQNYFKMVTFKYLSDIYMDIDRDRLTKMPPTGTIGKQKNSYDAQKYLRSLLTLCVEEKCKNGLNGKNEFERLRNYKTFVSENLDDLKKWSYMFYTNNSVIGYYVSDLGLDSYDFDKNGYWANLNLNVNIVSSGSGGRVSTIFEPKADYERDLMNKINIDLRNQIHPLQIFLAMSPEKAEKLQLNKVRGLYLVKKVKLTYKEVVSGYSTLLTLTYHYESPILEIYEDMALTKKIGTLSLEELILKKQ
ncbi:hypothetical protein [Yeosuana marina]|uniref:hypothetical protein n=1 Tax=Yeosuana marina TaxID=1565536 RepID=UPI0030EF3011|tara:strand:+ start:104 stop:1078 length:975 start_codon:yes stop_codon:yes gene_type:complete